MANLQHTSKKGEGERRFKLLGQKSRRSCCIKFFLKWEDGNLKSDFSQINLIFFWSEKASGKFRAVTALLKGISPFTCSGQGLERPAVRKPRCWWSSSTGGWNPDFPVLPNPVGSQTHSQTLCLSSKVLWSGALGATLFSWIPKLLCCAGWGRDLIKS